MFKKLIFGLVGFLFSAALTQAQGVYIDYNITSTRCDSSTGQIEITRVNTTPGPFRFSTDAINYSTDSVFSNLPVGDTYLYILDGLGNVLTELISINYLTDPVMEFNIENQVCDFQLGVIEVTNVINGQPPYTYFLDGEEVTGNELNEVPFGFHEVKIVDDNGCFRTQGAELTNECIIISTGFSPNGDGINDVWEIRKLNQFPANKVRVFNRYGQIVFKADNYNNTWNGNSFGLNLPIGTYYYEVEITSNQGTTQTFTGSLVILI